MSLRYLTIILDDTSPSFCHNNNPLTESRLISISNLRKAILFGMKENLMIYFVLPSGTLPMEYCTVMESIDHVKIGRDISICHDVNNISGVDTVVLRITIQDFLTNTGIIADSIVGIARLDICFTDIENFNDSIIQSYSDALSLLSEKVLELHRVGKKREVNILTDRIRLMQMANCGAGISNITLAPNGKFYLCPAFYYDEILGVDNGMSFSNPSSQCSIGDLDNGLDIPNSQLLQIENAPICRTCDAFHCHRCVWLNQKLTGDINTPSRQQCVMSHLERNASRHLLLSIYPERNEQVKQLDYLDPFEIIIRQ